jgi:hypothetical protein
MERDWVVLATPPPKNTTPKKQIINRSLPILESCSVLMIPDNQPGKLTNNWDSLSGRMFRRPLYIRSLPASSTHASFKGEVHWYPYIKLETPLLKAGTKERPSQPHRFTIFNSLLNGDIICVVHDSPHMATPSPGHA